MDVSVGAREQRDYSSTVRRATVCGSPLHHHRQRRRHRFTASISHVRFGRVGLLTRRLRHDARGPRAWRPRNGNGGDHGTTHAAKSPCPRPIMIIAHF